MNSKPTHSHTSRLAYVRITLAAAYLCGILFSLRLWFGVGRSAPRAPLITGTPDSFAPVEYLLSFLLVAALAFSLFGRRTVAALMVVVALTFLLVVLDQSRLQPWVYQYVLMLAMLACLKPGENQSDRTRAPETILLVNQLIVALLYFWSGIQKLNWSFGHEVVPALFERAGIHLPAAYAASFPVVAIVLAAGEALIGGGLIVRCTRRVAVVLAVSFHLGVLLLLVVSGSNSVVWPWNVAMMILVVLLFWKSEASLARKDSWRWRGNLVSELPKVVLILCAIAPALSFAGWWDAYLSGALYSGNTPVAVVRVSEEVRGQLPVTAQQQVFTSSGGESMLPLYEWSLADLNVPLYPEVRVYRQVARSLCPLAKDPGEIELIVKERPSLIDGSYKVSRTNCRDLLTR